MELFNLLVRPDHDFALRWHRDDIPATATEEEEEERLGVKRKPGNEHRSANVETRVNVDNAAQDKIREYAHAQWNLALEKDSSLIVVPGSHVRARTKEEFAADPFAEKLHGMQVSLPLSFIPAHSQEGRLSTSVRATRSSTTIISYTGVCTSTTCRG